MYTLKVPFLKMKSILFYKTITENYNVNNDCTKIKILLFKKIESKQKIFKSYT